MPSATMQSVMHGVVLCGMVWGCGAACLGAAGGSWRPAPLATLPIHPATHARIIQRVGEGAAAAAAAHTWVCSGAKARMVAPDATATCHGCESR